MKAITYATSIFLISFFAAHCASAALPGGYVELKAIQGDGAGAYIATGYIPKPNIDRIEAKFRIDVRTDANSTLFCSRIFNPAMTKAWTIFSNLSTYGMRFDYLNNKQDLKTGFTNGQMVELSVSSNVVTFADGSTLVSGNPYDPDFTEAGSQMFLFGANQNASTAVSNWSKDILYSFKVYRNDVLIHDYVPAKRSSDGKIGLYDAVTGDFFTNANSSGAFTPIYRLYHIAGNQDAGGTSSISGTVSGSTHPQGWSDSTNSTTRIRDGITGAYEQYYFWCTNRVAPFHALRTPNNASCATPSTSEIIFLPNSSVYMLNKSCGTGTDGTVATLTFNNTTLCDGSLFNFECNQNGRYTYVTQVGGSFDVKDGATLKFTSKGGGGNNDTPCGVVRLTATVTGKGTIESRLLNSSTAVTTSTAKFNQSISGNLSGFTGDLVVYRANLTYPGDLIHELVNANSIPADPAPGETAYVVVTNKAVLQVDQDWDSGENRIWNFGDSGVPTINVAAGKTVTIRGAVAGSVGFKKTGFGTLAFSGDLSGLSGTCEVLSGKVVLEGDACGYAHLFRGRADLIRNGGFEEGTSVVAHDGLYDANATTDAWGTAPLSKGNSSQGYGVPPSFITETYCAYIQNTNSISQAFTNTRPMTVTLAFRYMHRTNYLLSNPIYIRLLLDGEPLCNEVSVPCDSTIRTFSLGGIQIPSSPAGHVLRIQGRTDDNADSTFFLDDVSLRSETEVYSPGGKYEWLEIVRPSGAVYYLR